MHAILRSAKLHAYRIKRTGARSCVCVCARSRARVCARVRVLARAPAPARVWVCVSESLHLIVPVGQVILSICSCQKAGTGRKLNFVKEYWP